VEVEREIAEYVENLASCYVRFIQKRARRGCVTGAVRSLEVREFNQFHGRLGIASIEVTLGILTCRQVKLGRR
jgi:hypothetical protein